MSQILKKIITFIFLIHTIFGAEREINTVSVAPETVDTAERLFPYQTVDVSFIHSVGLETILSILEELLFKLEKIKEYRSENPPTLVVNPETHIPELVSTSALEKLEEELGQIQERYVIVAESFIAKIRTLRLEEIQKIGKLLGDLRGRAKNKNLLKALFLEKVESGEYHYLHGARECPLACMILKIFDQIALLRKIYSEINILPDDVIDILPVFDLFGRVAPEFIEMLSITIDAKITPFENILKILQHPHVGADIKIVNESSILNLDAFIKKHHDTKAVELHKAPYSPIELMLPHLSVLDFLRTRAALINYGDVAKAEQLMAMDSYKEMLESGDSLRATCLQIQQKIDKGEAILNPQEALDFSAARLALDGINKAVQLMQSLPIMRNYEENKGNLEDNKALARQHYDIANTFLRGMAGIDDSAVENLENLFADITKGCSQKEQYRQLFGIDPPLVKKRGLIVKHAQQKNHVDQHIWDIFLDHRPKMLWGNVVRDINSWNKNLREFGGRPFNVEVTPYNYRKVAMGVSLLTSLYGIAQIVMAGVNHLSIPCELLNEMLPIVNLLEYLAPSILERFIFHVDTTKTCVENIEYILRNRCVENLALLGLEKTTQESAERILSVWKKNAHHLKVGKIVMMPSSDVDVKNIRLILGKDPALLSTKASIEIVVNGANISGKDALSLVKAGPVFLESSAVLMVALKFINFSLFTPDVQVNILREVSANQKLQDLSLADIGISDADETVSMEIVEMIQKNGIKKLDVGNNKLGLLFMQRLDSIVRGSAIEVLRLNGNPITDEGARRLSAMMSKNPALQAIGVAACGLSEKGCEYIVDACLDAKSGIKMINFTGNQFSDSLSQRFLSNGFVSMKNTAVPNMDLAFANPSKSSR